MAMAGRILELLTLLLPLLNPVLMQAHATRRWTQLLKSLPLVMQVKQRVMRLLPTHLLSKIWFTGRPDRGRSTASVGGRWDPVAAPR